MATPLTVGGRHGSRITLTSVWGRLWGSILAEVRNHIPEPDATQGSGTMAAGESPAFIDLFARYHPLLLDYLYGMTRDRELAADLVQDTFMRAWVAAPDLTGILQPRAWLYRIATRVALDAIRHRGLFERLPLSSVGLDVGVQASDAWHVLPPVQLPPDPGDLAVGVAERDAIWTVLAELPPRWRAVLLLQTAAGFEVREIAIMQQLSEANVRKVLFRAKERFRALYRQLDEGGGEG
jgi:RNA polymerase sigma-70 factor (ECF subfamily)